MVAIAESVANVGRDYVSGFKRGAEFQTEAPSDIAVYRAELDGMSGIRELIHLTGAACGEIANAVTLGHFERKSFRDLTYGSNDVSYSGGDVMDFVKRYEVAHGLNVEEDSTASNDLEESVGGSDVRAARRKVNAVVNEYEAENGNSDDERDSDYTNGDVDTDRRVDDVGKAYDMAAKEDVGRVKMYEARKGRAGDSDYVEVSIDDDGNVDNKVVDTRYSFDKAWNEAEIMMKRHTRLNLNSALDEAEVVKRRMITQENGLARNIEYLSNLKLDEVRQRVGDGYMSTLNIPYVHGADGGERPQKKRDFNNDEKKVLVNRIMCPGN